MFDFYNRPIVQENVRRESNFYWQSGLAKTSFLFDLYQSDVLNWQINKYWCDIDIIFWRLQPVFDEYLEKEVKVADLRVSLSNYSF